MQNGFTPVYRASENGHTENLELLLANKANINAKNKAQLFKYSNTCD
jgi:ankyrin repeat protein